MLISSPRQYSRCFISAPFGINLGVLPLLLGERQIAWNWAEDGSHNLSYSISIQRCDFVVAILNGSQSDQRILYEAGLAQGLGKPVFFVAISKRVGRVARSLFSPPVLRLDESTALAFQLDAFLSTPHAGIFDRDQIKNISTPIVPPSSDLPIYSQKNHVNLQERVYNAIREAGGSAILEPSTNQDNGRPDLVIWLPEEDLEFLDPAIIEIKYKLPPSQAQKVERHLLDFMQISGVKCGFILSEQGPPEGRKAISPYVFWLSVEKFISLTLDKKLGKHIRHLRNHAIHGAG